MLIYSSVVDFGRFAVLDFGCQELKLFNFQRSLPSHFTAHCEPAFAIILRILNFSCWRITLAFILTLYHLQIVLDFWAQRTTINSDENSDNFQMHGLNTNPLSENEKVPSKSWILKATGSNKVGRETFWPKRLLQAVGQVPFGLLDYWWGYLVKEVTFPSLSLEELKYRETALFSLLSPIAFTRPTFWTSLLCTMSLASQEMDPYQRGWEGGGVSQGPDKSSQRRHS